MTVVSFVFLPGSGSPGRFRFRTLPRIGDQISLPDCNQSFLVESVEHIARELTDTDRPTVQMHLKSLPSYRNRLAPRPSRRQGLSARWRR